jgi:taurine dioxygenase
MGIVSTKDLQPFGVEVDLDLANELDPAVADELRDLLWHRHLLVFRRQTFTFEQQIALMKQFGPVHREDDSASDYGSSSNKVNTDYVSIDSEIGFLGAVQLAFHQDLAMAPQPLIALSLFAVDVEPDTTSTMFVDATDMYRGLSPELQHQLGGLESLHIFPSQGNGSRLRSTSAGGSPVDLSRPHTFHAVVMAHPVTGEKILFVNQLFTDHVVGLDDAASEELLSSIFERAYRPENIYEHRWDLGDLVLWDNLAVQHARGDQSHVTRRTLRRVVCGEQPTYFQKLQALRADLDQVAATIVLDPEYGAATQDERKELIRHHLLLEYADTDPGLVDLIEEATRTLAPSVTSPGAVQ